jgi:hypothetical protein
MFGQLQSSLTQITQTITGALSGQLTQVTNLLQTLLAGTGGKAGPGAATGGLQLPPFISNLLGSLGLGSLFPTSSAGH